MKRFPKELFVKWEGTGNDEEPFLIVDDPLSLAEIGIVKAAKYRLVMPVEIAAEPIIRPLMKKRKP